MVFFLKDFNSCDFISRDFTFKEKSPRDLKLIFSDILSQDFRKLGLFYQRFYFQVFFSDSFSPATFLHRLRMQERKNCSNFVVLCKTEISISIMHYVHIIYKLKNDTMYSGSHSLDVYSIIVCTNVQNEVSTAFTLKILILKALQFVLL